MKVTGDTITDAQIRAVGNTPAQAEDVEDVGDYASLGELARFALLGRPSARRRCAEILNARSCRDLT